VTKSSCFLQVGALDSAAVQAAVDDAAAQAHKLAKARPGDAVVAQLKGEVESFKGEVPLLQEVR
jgi:hypothetical protein